MPCQRPTVVEFPALTEEEFRRLCDFLYRRTGMVFTEAKRYYVERRVVERMVATGTGSFAGYFAHLRTDVQQEIELFINAFTVNETYFYREDHQLQCLTSDLLAERVSAKPRGEGLRIWCAPCSTGEEPYSVAIWLLENWPLVDQYEIEILGSDIDTEALQACGQGIFGKRALMRLPENVINRYFEPLGNERWRILDELRQSVQFSRVNLVEPAETRPHGQFDVIFCRNVLIYFDQTTKANIFDRLSRMMEPDGVLALGAAESVVGITSAFKPYPDRRGLYRPNVAPAARGGITPIGLRAAASAAR